MVSNTKWANLLTNFAQIAKQIRPFWSANSPKLVRECISYFNPQSVHQNAFTNIRHWCSAPCCLDKFLLLKPKSDIRPHLLRFTITDTLPYRFSPLADICAAITSRRSPLRLRWNVGTSACAIEQNQLGSKDRFGLKPKRSLASFTNLGWNYIRAVFTEQIGQWQISFPVSVSIKP